MQGELSLEQLLLGIGKAKVGEDVSAGFGYSGNIPVGVLCFHFSFASLCNPTWPPPVAAYQMSILTGRGKERKSSCDVPTHLTGFGVSSRYINILFHGMNPVQSFHAQGAVPVLRALEVLRPALCAVVDGEDHDSGLLDGVRGDKGSIRNDQLTGAGNPASSA